MLKPHHSQYWIIIATFVVKWCLNFSDFYSNQSTSESYWFPTFFLRVGSFWLWFFTCLRSELGSVYLLLQPATEQAYGFWKYIGTPNLEKQLYKHTLNCMYMYNHRPICRCGEAWVGGGGMHCIRGFQHPPRGNLIGWNINWIHPEIVCRCVKYTSASCVASRESLKKKKNSHITAMVCTCIFSIPILFTWRSTGCFLITNYHNYQICCCWETHF